MYEGVLVTVTGAECTQADLDADHDLVELPHIASGLSLLWR